MGIYDVFNNIRTVLKKGDNILGDNMNQTEHVAHYREFIQDDIKKFNHGYTKFPIYAYLFNLSFEGFVTEYDLVNFDEVIRRMYNYSSSLWNDFYEETRNWHWLKINRFFFRNAFFHPTIYVHQDRETKEYSIYIRTSNTTGKDDISKFKHTYINLKTHDDEYFSNPDEDLVEYSWNQDPEDNNRFEDWFNFSYHMTCFLGILKNQIFLHDKILQVKTIYQNKPISKELINAAKSEIYRLSPFITDFKVLKVLNEGKPIVDATQLKTLEEAIYIWCDRQISELGRVANLNPKKERRTTGENYIAVDRITDHLRGIQDSLDAMTGEMTEKGFDTLVFKVNTEVSLEMGGTGASGPGVDPPSDGESDGDGGGY